MAKSIHVERHLERVASLGCVMTRHLFGEYAAAEIHHLFDPSQRSDWLVVPLSPEFHRGANGFHGLGGERGFRARYKLGEVELLGMTIEALAKL